MSDEQKGRWRAFMPDDVREALERFHEDQATQWTDRQVITVALRHFFESLGYMMPEKPREHQDTETEGSA